MGYPMTTGLQAIDYYFSDRYFSPPGMLDAQFTEKLLLLPASAPFLPPAEAPAVKPPPALENSHITLGGFNRPSKLSKKVISRWRPCYGPCRTRACCWQECLTSR